MKARSFMKQKKNTKKTVFDVDVSKLAEYVDDQDCLIIPHVNKKENEFTNISDIMKINNDTFISFYDRIRNPKKWVITMHDDVYMKKLPLKTDIKCFWCRNNFETSPIGCPIKNISSEFIEKWTFNNTGYSLEKINHISSVEIKDIKENIESFYGNLTEKRGNIEVEQKILESGKYLVSKIFCSFNCTQSFINEELEKNNKLYEHSTYLLANMYKSYTGRYHTDKIPTAPSWELLKEYGGKLTIEEYRKSFMTSTYSKVKNIYVPIGAIYSEEIIF